MKKMAREVLLETLKENGGSLPFNVVERKLWDHGLGFGVEPINVVHSAARDNLVDYDSKTRIVSQILNEFKIPRVFKGFGAGSNRRFGVAIAVSSFGKH
ncbi:MAG: hypothetical protein UV48_C0019G0008 [Candidatus Azambacteria bacterium GW2011_GWA2_42_9]|uniref:Uncharacterized protein n=1 Tax=Candidatus Azambacteria bacterium GW2011_GWA2_42_9 TaxID=1618613 RepID=A0A0G1EKJ3_9BACT|nr:MAG: hypothetical protein UV48_C0019G0008 [Candidatus Azambacteria bacterium GW2011_GWA2_42_9]